jgi:hypothetical protein
MSKAAWFAALCGISLLAGCGEVATGEYQSSSSGDNPSASSSSFNGVSSSSFNGVSSSSSGFDINDLEWVPLDGYEISRNLITQGQYKSVMGENPSKGIKNDSRPIDGVNWFKAVEFCERLSVSLPTEEEWEDAARQEAIQRDYDYWEWTSYCYNGLCIRKGLVNRIDDFYTTDPNLDNIASGYISFRVVRY